MKSALGPWLLRLLAWRFEVEFACSRGLEVRDMRGRFEGIVMALGCGFVRVVMEGDDYSDWGILLSGLGCLVK